MTQVSSGTWTGLADDTFADLSDAERQGTLVFAPSAKSLARDRILAIGCAAATAGGLLWIALRSIGGAETANVPVLSLAAILFLAFVGAVTTAIVLSRRLSEIGLTSPLRFTPDALLVGTKEREIPFRRVQSVRQPSPARGLHEFVAAFLGGCFFLLRRSNMKTLEIATRGRETVLDIDLNLLDADPERVLRILKARIALAKASPQNPHG